MVNPLSHRKLTQLSLACLLTGCSTANHYDNLQPIEVISPTIADPIAQEQTLDQTPISGEQVTGAELNTGKPKLAIAFGGGASRGVMHLGVIKTLEEAGIEADIVTGTSVGSIAAALYSSHDYQQVEKIILEFAEHEIVDLNLPTKGVIKGKALAKWINSHVDFDTIEALPKTTGIVATNLTQKKTVVFTSGDIGQAVQASSSVPGVFMPVYYQDDIIVDGGVTSLVPVYAARQLGADIVLGIDVFCGAPPPLKYSAVHTLANAFWLQSCLVTEAETQSADVLLTPEPYHPSLKHFGDLYEREQAMQVGYEAMQAALPELLELLGERGKPSSITSFK
ncbi:patatin-like phospholipase family protein [Vibrio sp. WXL103]|uniref:patatin-like phospholipase family protein n=1 Tax=Vibrio sp. WXL103 TaxID=3450710 RepID=UPI003EC6BA9E